jgi:hypothetical protein
MDRDGRSWVAEIVNDYQGRLTLVGFIRQHLLPWRKSAALWLLPIMSLISENTLSNSDWGNGSPCFFPQSADYIKSKRQIVGRTNGSGKEEVKSEHRDRPSRQVRRMKWFA